MAPATQTRTTVPLTNKQRTARTRTALLEATLDCLTKNGYTGTSTTDVVKRAGVSRGALAHHFPSKAQLVAEAAAYLVNKRASYTAERLRDIGPNSSALEEWVRTQWHAYEKWFPANIEFMIAARTNEDLREHFAAAIDSYSEALLSAQADVAPEMSSSPSPLLTQYVIGCFIRGLCLERIVNDDELIEQIFDEFIRLIGLAIPESD